MKLRRDCVCIVLCICFWQIRNSPALANGQPQEYVTTTPVIAEGVLYVASSIYPRHRGHLRAIDILDTFPVTLWDAAERVPLAGVGSCPGDLANSDPPARIQCDNLYRSIFTNLAGTQLPLTAGQAAELQQALGVASAAEAERLVHAVRGRRGGTPDQVAGSTDDPQRLWSISRSSPVLVGRSPLNALTAHRERVLYVGAEDGLLHAIFVSRWNAEAGNYLIYDPDGGKELWAYLPGSFLSHLKEQPLDDNVVEIAIHLDGSPVVRELFLDLDGDGRRNWSTLLIGTGTIVQDRRSCLFVLDITDPYQPELLWEKLLPGEAVGRTRGITVDRCGADSTSSSCIYLTADFAAGSESPGIHALALDLETGQLLWTFSAPYAPYAVSGPVTDATPAVPVLMDLNGNGRSDTLVFGDLVGQLWALDLEEGHAYGDAPIYQLPAGPAEPIGAGVAVQGRLVVFGSGGVEEADNNYQYAVYAVEILPEGGRLLWTYPLAVGEKVWQAPVVDAAGNLLFGTAIDYLPLSSPTIEQPTSGRVVALNSAGEQDVSRETSAATVAGIVMGPGVAVSVALTGEVTQLGSASRLVEAVSSPGSVRILSWRQR